MRRRVWFRLSFCQGWTTASLCWHISLKTGWTACREYKTMQLVLSLADEGETMQSRCSDLSTGCQSELGLSTRFPPCAIVAEIHLLLLTDLIFCLSIHLPALCVLQTLVSWLFHASNSTSMESVLSHTQDLWPGIPSPNLCLMLQVFPPSNPIWKRSSSKSICTEDFHSKTHQCVGQIWQFPVYLAWV